MSRRERTTALPRQRRREKVDTRRTFAGITWDDRTARLAILGTSVALLALVLLAIGMRIYHERIGHPNEVVLEVGGEEFKLGYYADRLLQFAQANPGGSASTTEEALLKKFEEEALTIQAAKARGIQVSDADVTNKIAQSLGVPVGGSGSSFDTLYRARLASLKMSDSNYRRMTEAEVYNDRLLEALAAEIGQSGELVALRAILLDSEEKAKQVLDRIKAGEDMGSVAQLESADLTSRQEDGLLPADPPALFPEVIRSAITDKAEGTLLDAPVQVQTYWWVLKVEKRDPAGAYTETHKEQLAEVKLREVLDAQRSQVKISRDIDAGDFRWAEEHAN